MNNVNIKSFLVLYATEIEMISSIISQRKDKLKSNVLLIYIPMYLTTKDTDLDMHEIKDILVIIHRDKATHQRV